MDTKLKDQPDNQYYYGSMEACVKVRDQGEGSMLQPLDLYTMVRTLNVLPFIPFWEELHWFFLSVAY